MQDWAAQPTLILGGAQGIGLAIATAFANVGAPVCIVDRTEKVHVAAATLGAIGIVADATDPTKMPLALDAMHTQVGPVHHLVVAVGAGSGHYGFPFWNVPIESWNRVWTVNLVSAVLAAQLCAPVLTQHRRGTILFLSSVAAQIGSQTDPPYSAAKAGLLNFMECAAKDYASYGVRVNAICPGMVRTELNQAVWQAWNAQQPAEKQLTYDDWTAEKIRRTVPLGRWQTAEDIAAAALFLASNAAANITGQTLNVDGGQVMHW